MSDGQFTLRTQLGAFTVEVRYPIGAVADNMKDRVKKAFSTAADAFEAALVSSLRIEDAATPEPMIEQE